MSEQLTEKTVQLDTPIKRGKAEIAEIVLRKPDPARCVAPVCRRSWIWTSAR